MPILYLPNKTKFSSPQPVAVIWKSACSHLQKPVLVRLGKVALIVKFELFYA